MADTDTDPAVAYGTTTVPTAAITLSALPPADPLNGTDYLWGSQYVATDGRYRSRRLTFAQVQSHGRPPCTYINADHTAAATEVGFYLDPTTGDLTLTLPPVATVNSLEIALIHVGTAGIATIAGTAPDALVLPGGLAGPLTFRPGETARLRAVVVPSPARSGWYLVGV